MLVHHSDREHCGARQAGGERWAEEAVENAEVPAEVSVEVPAGWAQSDA